MDVLAIDGELFGKVTIQLGHQTVTFGRENSLVIPALKGVCTTANNGDIHFFSVGQQQLLDLTQLLPHGRHAGMHTGRNLDHGFRDLRFDIKAVGNWF